jgi:hypothetical protein
MPLNKETSLHLLFTISFSALQLYIATARMHTEGTLTRLHKICDSHSGEDEAYRLVGCGVT